MEQDVIFPSLPGLPFPELVDRGAAWLRAGRAAWAASRHPGIWGRTGWQDAYAAARADVELTDAHTQYRWHEHRVTVYRTQAVVVLKALERQAMLWLEGIPAVRRAQLEALAQEMGRCGQELAALTADFPACGRCVRRLQPDQRGGDCCSGMVFLAWDELDGVSRVLLGERAPLPTSFAGDPTRCGLLGPQGCRLPAGARPTVCTAFFCAGLKADLRRAGRSPAVLDRLLRLDQARAALGFRLNLIRRFAPAPSMDGRSEGDHPLDFIWGRLRRRGSEFALRQDADNSGGEAAPASPEFSSPAEGQSGGGSGPAGHGGNRP